MEKIIESLNQFVPFNRQEEEDKKKILDFILENDDYLLRNNEKGHVTVSCWITNKKHDKYLMCYHNIYDSYSWCGGHADGESDLIKVALKEAREETGLSDFIIFDDIFSVECLDVKEHIKKGKLVKRHIHYNVTFLMEADEKEKLHIKEDENKDLKWFSEQEVLSFPKEKWMCNVIYTKLLKKCHKIFAKNKG